MEQYFEQSQLIKMDSLIKRMQKKRMELEAGYAELNLKLRQLNDCLMILEKMKNAKSATEALDLTLDLYQFSSQLNNGQ